MPAGQAGAAPLRLSARHERIGHPDGPSSGGVDGGGKGLLRYIFGKISKCERNQSVPTGFSENPNLWISDSHSKNQGS